jgi:hypothetical protein
MADNINVTPGTGASVAADEIAGALHQRVKITVGADGVNDGDVSSANPMPVAGTVDLGATDNAVLDAIAASVASADSKAPALGQALAAASVPVVLPAAQITTLTPPPAITGYATSAKQDAEAVLIGAVNETAPATDTANSGLNGRLQRIAQRITSLIALIPTALTAGGNFKTAVQEALPAGDNNIGNVDLASAIPAGTNNIGDVDVLTLPALPAGDNNIGNVDLASAIPAGTNLIGKVSASDETSTVYNGTTALTPKFAVIDHATSGNNTIVAAVADKKIRVLSAFIVAAGAVTARFESGADGTALTGQMSLAANSGFVLPYNPLGWFETAASALLNLELGGAVSVDGSITYIEV